MPKQPRLIPDQPSNPLAGNFSQKRVRLSSLTIKQLMQKWHHIGWEYGLAKDTASAPVTVCPPSEKRRAAKQVRNLGQQKGRVGKVLQDKLTKVTNQRKVQQLTDHLLLAYEGYVSQHGTDYIDAFAAIDNLHQKIIRELESKMDLPPRALRDVAADTFTHNLKKA